MEPDLTPTMEDYLEAIYSISQGKRVVRVKNIAKEVGVKMPTVTNMLKSLNQKGFIDYEKREFLELTPKGRKVGKEIKRRHQIIRNFLTDILKVDSDVADQEACKIEHGMSAKTLDRLTQFIDFTQASQQMDSDRRKSNDGGSSEAMTPEARLRRLKATVRYLNLQIKRLEAGEEV